MLFPRENLISSARCYSVVWMSAVWIANVWCSTLEPAMQRTQMSDGVSAI